MKDIETVVSENIQKLIEEYNLTHAKLAKIADVSVSTVGKWVLKKATPRMGSVQKISDHFNIPKAYILKEEETKLPKGQQYPYIENAISAGVPITMDGIEQADTISLPDSVMGKWAGNKDIVISPINGESMNKTIPHGSLIAVKSMNPENLKDGDIVVFSTNYEYSVKRMYKRDDHIIFRPHSTDFSFTDNIVEKENGLKIHGKVVLYIVELD